MGVVLVMGLRPINVSIASWSAMALISRGCVQSREVDVPILLLAVVVAVAILVVQLAVILILVVAVGVDVVVATADVVAHDHTRGKMELWSVALRGVTQVAVLTQLRLGRYCVDLLIALALGFVVAVPRLYAVVV